MAFQLIEIERLGDGRRAERGDRAGSRAQAFPRSGASAEPESAPGVRTAPTAKRGGGLLVAAWLSVACSSLEVGARPPSPTVENREQVAGSVVADLSDFPAGLACASSAGVKELCIADLRVAFEYGFRNVGAAMFSGAGPRYVLTFRLLELGHFPLALTHPGQPAASKVSLTWQLQMKDNRGKVLVAVSKVTDSPKLIYRDEDAAEAVAQLVDRTLTDVVAVLDEFGAAH